MKKKKILICSYPGDYSGVPIYTKSIINLLSDKAEFTVYTSSNSGIYDNLDADIIVQNKINNTFKPLQVIKNIQLFLSFIKTKKYDLIHLNGTMFGMIGRIISIYSKYNFIYTYHGLPWGPGRRFFKSSIFLIIEILMLNLSKAKTISISKMDKKRLGKINLFNKKIHYVVNSVEMKSLNEKHSIAEKNTNLNIINVARYSKQKNFKRLFHAFNLIKEDFTLTLVGFGTDSFECLALAKSICSKKKISMIRFKGVSRDVQIHLSKADIFVLSSDYEGMPLSAIEAMTCGLPLIVPEVGGSDEFEACGAAEIYSPNTAEKLAEKIHELAFDKTKLDKMSLAGQKGYKKIFSKKKFSEHMRLIYGIEDVG